MFRRLHEPARTLRIRVNGRVVEAGEGESVAAALLAAGIAVFRRSALSGDARGAYCGMGVCFECLVTIDGAANRQACLTPVREGMAVETGGGAPDLAGAQQPPGEGA